MLGLENAMSRTKLVHTKRAAAIEAVKRIEALVTLTREDEFMQEVLTSAHEAYLKRDDQGERVHPAVRDLH